MNSSEKFTSPYYPRRARWYARIFYFGGAIRHRLALDRIHLPKDITLGGLVGSFLVPGLGFYLRDPKLYGKMALAACALLFGIFIVWLGYPIGNYAFGLIISIHASGIAYYCSPYLRDKEFFIRIGFTVLVLIGISLGIFLPIRHTIQNHLLLPLRLNGHVIVVQKIASPKNVRRGDWIAYNLLPASDSGDDLRIHFQAGVGFGPILATAGDNVGFSTNTFFVNGISHTLLPHMPTSGNLTVPENDWFIWPSYSINGGGNENRISSTMLQMANVSENQFIGKPFKRWFWRKQILQ